MLRGQVFKFGDNIDTDQIYPGRYLELVEPNEIAAHCLEGADLTFVKKMHHGDIVVAGRNFGCGSSREHAPITLLNAGVGAVVAESFARIFFRNAINLALPLMVCPGIDAHVSNGDTLTVDIACGIVQNETTGETIQGELLSEYVMAILSHGGIKPMMRAKYSNNTEI
jgi:3-isopropylmalate/(R)-2-methylmalate dehydratase small subunit